MPKNSQGRTLPEIIKFQDTEIRIVDRKGCPWVTSTDLARALGYARTDKITELYNRNKVEFSADMSETLKMGASGNLQKTVRIYNARGAHLIAMFARTERAKAFRRWVLDVLDNMGHQAALPPQEPLPPSGGRCIATEVYNEMYADVLSPLEMLAALRLQQNGLGVVRFDDRLYQVDFSADAATENGSVLALLPVAQGRTPKIRIAQQGPHFNVSGGQVYGDRTAYIEGTCPHTGNTTLQMVQAVGWVQRIIDVPIFRRRRA